MSGIEHVHPGMRVVDSLGQDLGTVDRVEPGDGGPVTTQGDGGLPDGLARALAGSRHVHPQTAARMVRRGYVEIRRTGASSGRGYVAADQIGHVSGDVVRLTVSGADVLGG